MDDFSPYQPPQSYDSVASRYGAAQKPTVVTWYQVYCGVCAVLGMALIVGGVFLANLPEDLRDGNRNEEFELMMAGVIYGGAGLFTAVLMTVGLLVPRANWGYIYGMVMICLGLTSCCTIPACIPLLIFWIKPEVKQYFTT